MKNKLQQFIVKLLAATLAIIMAVPTNVFAMSQRKSNTYTAATSVMGIQTQDDTPEEVANTETSLLKSAVSTAESTDYILEKSANLSQTTGQVTYKIAVKTKDPSKEFTENQTTTFGITENTDLNELKVEKVQALDANGKEIYVKNTLNTPKAFNSTDNIRTLGITATKPQYGMVYYLSAQLTEEALKNLEEKSPQLALDITIASPNQDIFQTRYSLETTKPDTTEITIDNDGNVVNQTSELVEKEDNLHLYKGEYKKEEKTLFQTTPAHLVWTDYINAKDDKEFTINFDLDENQNTENSQINIDYYEARDKGYVLNQSFSKTVDFTKSLNLTIPQGYIAKVSLSTAIKENTNAKEYTFNGVKVANPTYKEEKNEKTEEEQTTDDADPLPDNSSKNDGETKPSTDSIADESEQDFSQNPKSDTSAIALNKEAYLENLRDEEKLTENLEKAANDIELALESYNKEETNWDEFKATIQTIAKEQNLDQAQAEETLQALLAGLNEDKYKVANVDPVEVVKSIPEAQTKDKDEDTATQDNLEEDTPTSEEKKLPETKTLSNEEIKTLIKEEFSKTKNGEISEEELEASLANIREENNIDAEDFFNILAEIYYSGEDLGLDVLDTKDSEESLPTIEATKTKEEALAEKLEEDNLDVEKFITFLHSYVKEYDLDEDALENILRENETEVKSIIGEFTIDEIVLSVFLKNIEPNVLATDPNSVNVVDSGFANERFITELEYFTETLTRGSNINKLYEIARTNKGDENTSEQLIRNKYVGWRINLPGVDKSGMDIREIKKDKYKYDNMEFSIYAPIDQGLKNYKVVVEDGNNQLVNISNVTTKTDESHYIYGFTIPKNELTEAGYNIYVVAEAAEKRQNYAVGVRVSPDKNYVKTFVDSFDERYEELERKYPFLLKWKDTSAGNPYREGINLLDTRMVYLEPTNWQDMFPYNGFRSVDYNDNTTDTDILKNTVSMFGNITENGNITWTISETFTAEKLEDKNTIGKDAYSAKVDGKSLGNPSVQILIPNGSDYDLKDLGNVDITTLQNRIGAKPGTIVNYTYKSTTQTPKEYSTIQLNSGKSAKIAYKDNLLNEDDDFNQNNTSDDFTHMVHLHRDGPGYEVALGPGPSNVMKAFIPENTSADPRYRDPAYTTNGAIVFCINPGKPEPTKQYKFNSVITKEELSTDKSEWVKNGKRIASLTTAKEAKASPLYKGTLNDAFYSSLYEYTMRLFWYAQEMVDEYGTDQINEDAYYKMVQYNLDYYIAGPNYAEAFRTLNGYVPYYFSNQEYTFAKELNQRIANGNSWSEDKAQYVDIFMYGHDKTTSYQNTITGDAHKPNKKGSITINKSSEGRPLPGATFELLDENKKRIMTSTSGADGVVKFDNLELNKSYYYREIQAPVGYEFDSKLIGPVRLTEAEQNYQIPAVNTKNQIKFKKLDENLYPFSGVEFSLKRNGIATSKVTSKADGTFSWSGLTPGSYEVVESNTNNPDYSDNNGKVVARFQVDSNNKITNKEILPEYQRASTNNTEIVNRKNEPEKGRIEFQKVDAKSPTTPLAGAEFILQQWNGRTYKDLSGTRAVADSNGRFRWSGLEDGIYRVYETKAPSNPNYDDATSIGAKTLFEISNGKTYLLNEDRTRKGSEITSASVNKITNNQKPKEGQGKFKIIKTGKDDTGKEVKLEGVEFTLESDGEVGPDNAKQKYKKALVTDSNGEITFDKLYEGTYTLKETNTRPGYQQKNDTWSVRVDSNGKTTLNGNDSSEFTNSIINKTEKVDWSYEILNPDSGKSTSKKTNDLSEDSTKIATLSSTLSKNNNIASDNNFILKNTITGESSTGKYSGIDLMLIVESGSPTHDESVKLVNDYNNNISNLITDISSLDSNARVAMVNFDNDGAEFKTSSKDGSNWQSISSIKENIDIIKVENKKTNKTLNYRIDEGIKLAESALKTSENNGRIKIIITVANGYKSAIKLDGENSSPAIIAREKNIARYATEWEKYTNPKSKTYKNVDGLAFAYLYSTSSNNISNFYEYMEGSQEYRIASHPENVLLRQLNSGSKTYTDIDNITKNKSTWTDFSAVKKKIVDNQEKAGLNIKKNLYANKNIKVELNSRDLTFNDGSSVIDKTGVSTTGYNNTYDLGSKSFTAKQFTDNDNRIRTQTYPDGKKVEYVDYNIINSVNGSSQVNTPKVRVTKTTTTIDNSVVLETPEFNITNDRTPQPEPTDGQITIHKTDSQDKTYPLDGAVFQLFTRTNGEYIPVEVNGKPVTSTTNGDGIAKFDNLQRGVTYYVKEIKSPDGYRLLENQYTQTNVGGVTEITNTKEDDSKGKIELYKKDHKGEVLEGATFELWKDGKKVQGPKITDSKGYLSFTDLEYGDYILKETQAPNGFEAIQDLDITVSNVITSQKSTSQNGDITIEKINNSVILTVKDNKEPEKTSIDFVKRDFGDKTTPLSGAEFALYKKDDNGDEIFIEDSLTSSDTDGAFGWGDLDQTGQYVVYETRTPAGYPDLEEGEKVKVATFDVTRNGNILSTENINVVKNVGEITNNENIIYNKANEIKFKKVDADDQSPIENAKFKLVIGYNEVNNGNTEYKEKTVADDISSDANGNFSFSVKEPGRYRVVETSAPNGYREIPQKGITVAEFTVENNTMAIKNILVNNEFVTDSKQVTDEFEIENKKRGDGRFQLQKFGRYEDKDKVLGDAIFLLKDTKSGEYIKIDGTIANHMVDAKATTSNTTGLIEYNGISDGTYELREFKAPDGYIRSSNVWTVKVENGQTRISAAEGSEDDKLWSFDNANSNNPAKLNVINNKNEIEFTKKSKTSKEGEEEKILPGAQFEVWWDQQANRDTDGNINNYKTYVRYPNANTVFTTDAEGKIKLNGLPEGHYKIYEVKTPYGHYIEEKPYDNEPIYEANGEFVKEFFVDGDGYIKQTKDALDEKNNIVVKEDYTVIHNTPYKGKLRLLKVNNKNIPLKGVVFKLSEDKLIGGKEYTATTNTNGAIEFNNIPAGTYTLEETEPISGYISSEQKWTVTVGDTGKTTIAPKDNISAYNDIQMNSIIPTSYAAETDISTEKADFFFVIEKDDFNSEGVDKFNKEFQSFRQSIIDKYGDNARIAVVTYNSNNNKEHNQVYSLVKATDPSLDNVKIETYKALDRNIWPHIDHGLDSVMDMVDNDRTIKRNMVLITSGENSYYFNGYAPKYNISENFDNVVVYSLSDKTEATGDYSPAIDYASIDFVKDNKDVTKGSLESWGTFDKAEAKFDIADENKTHIDYIENLSDKDLAKLNSNGYLIANVDTNGGDDASTIKVVNKKPTYPSTGGSGTFIGFALIGTAIMLAGIAYYGIYVNDKNRRRSNRYDK